MYARGMLLVLSDAMKSLVQKTIDENCEGEKIMCEDKKKINAAMTHAVGPV
jgi:hypothetical protein